MEEMRLRFETLTIRRQLEDGGWSVWDPDRERVGIFDKDSNLQQ